MQILSFTVLKIYEFWKNNWLQIIIHFEDLMENGMRSKHNWILSDEMKYVLELIS